MRSSSAEPAHYSIVHPALLGAIGGRRGGSSCRHSKKRAPGCAQLVRDDDRGCSIPELTGKPALEMTCEKASTVLLSLSWKNTSVAERENSRRSPWDER